MKNTIVLNTTAPWKHFLYEKISEMEAYRQGRASLVDNFNKVITEVEKMSP